jgi:hypothetical protein
MNFAQSSRGPSLSPTLGPWEFPVEVETPEELAAAAAEARQRQEQARELNRQREIERRREIEREEALREDYRRRVRAELARKAELRRMKDETAAAKLKAAKLDVALKERALEKGAPPAAVSTDAMGATLDDRRFDIANPPPRPVPLLSLGDHVLCTAGNLSNLQAPAKAGKSAVIGAIMAAMLDGRRQGSDTLGFLSENPDGKALIHLDTEQSRHDHHALVMRSLSRARLDVPPPWFMSFSLADMSIPERVAALELLIEQGGKAHGGVFAVIVDGIADLVFDPNESGECFALVGQLHALAIKHEAAILTVLHENPGAVEGKTRGHLGSQLERKAETNLRLAKDSNGITTIFAERARHAHIPRDAGTCFQWSDAAGMHVSCGDARTIKASAKATKAREEAAAVFLAGECFTFSELRDAITETLTVAERTATRRIQSWQADGILLRGRDERYRLA